MGVTRALTTLDAPHRRDAQGGGRGVLYGMAGACRLLGRRGVLYLPDFGTCRPVSALTLWRLLFAPPV